MVINTLSKDLEISDIINDLITDGEFWLGKNNEWNFSVIYTHEWSKCYEDLFILSSSEDL